MVCKYSFLKKILKALVTLSVQDLKVVGLSPVWSNPCHAFPDTFVDLECSVSLDGIYFHSKTLSASVFEVTDKLRTVFVESSSIPMSNISFKLADVFLLGYCAVLVDDAFVSRVEPFMYQHSLALSQPLAAFSFVYYDDSAVVDSSDALILRHLL